MTTPTVNFVSYNSTGMNSIKSSWIRDFCKVTKTDYLSLQEHFKKTKSVDTYFKEQFSDHMSYVIPAYRDQCQDSGRPKGGLAQLTSKRLQVKSQRISTKNFRIQAQVLHFPTTKLLWINSYLPNDPQTINFDDHELLQTLTEVENILDTADFDDVCWVGDLNWDMNRQSGFSRTMSRFTERLGLVSVWNKFPVGYTHMHTDFSSTSTLDHFLVNPRLLAVVVDAGAIHLGDNLSRHSPIMMKLGIGNLPVREIKKLKPTRRPAWYKAEQEQIDNYTNELQDKLAFLTVAESLNCSNCHCDDHHHTQERDNLVLDVMTAMIETSHQTIPMSGSRKAASDLDKNCFVEKSIPG